MSVNRVFSLSRKYVTSLFCRQSPASLRFTPVSSTTIAAVRLMTTASKSMSEDEKFWFDLNGFVKIKNVFNKEEVTKMNQVIDKRNKEFKQRDSPGLRNTKDDSPLAGDKVGRKDMGGMLAWPSPDSDLFRSVLNHPNLLSYYLELVGEGYRLDHLPLILAQNKGTEGFSLHGGPVNDDGSYNNQLAYGFHRGKMHNAVVTVLVQLTDIKEGDGGFAVVRGSHKSNYVCPDTLRQFTQGQEHVYQPAIAAGDAIIFSEAAIHGTLPWKPDSERRGILFRFAPCNMAYGRGYISVLQNQHPGMLEGLSDAQRAVLEPPYNQRLDRVVIANGGAVKRIKRDATKKAFDKMVFNTDYF